MSKFVIKKSADSQYFWNFVASNGQIITTTERYTTKQSAQKSIALVQTEAAHALVEDETVPS